jgi:DNA polymerase III subunit gamma/tau
MFTQQYRSRVFGELYGQEAPAEVLHSMIKNPQNSPRSIIMCGDYGTGKTTCARLLAKGLNCKSRSDKRPCGVCEICKSDLSYVPFYQEFDSGDVGNVDAIKELKGTFFSASTVCDWRVVVFDECHLISKPAQAQLLTTLEAIPENMFIVFCSTDVESIITTIRSRSIELIFRTLSIEEIIENLQRIAKSENLQVSDEIMYYIAITSKGHVRDSVMLLDLYAMMEDKTKFVASVRSAESKVIEFLIAVRSGDEKVVSDAISALARCVLESIRNDFYLVLNSMIYDISCNKISSSYFVDLYKRVGEVWGQDIFKLFMLMMQDWAVNSFKNDTTVQAMLWLIYTQFRYGSAGLGSGAKVGGAASLMDRNKAAMHREG